MKTFEIFTEKHSYITQANSIISALNDFLVWCKDNRKQSDGLDIIATIEHERGGEFLNNQAC